MKNYFTEIIKQIIISVLIVICIIIVLSLIFYDKIALTRVIPEAEEYFISEKMEEEIEESDLESTEEVVIKYHIDSSDLRKYEKANEYVKGKSNPFAQSSWDNHNLNTLNNSTSSPNTNDSSNKGFFEDDGTK